MRRFNEKEKKKIINLRKKGKSLFEICNKLEVSISNKSSVYYHLRKVFGRSFKLVKINNSNLEYVGEIIGAFASDGDSVPQTGYQVRFSFSLDEEKYVYEFAKILEAVFNKSPYIYKPKNNNRIIIRYKSKLIYYDFLLKYLEWDKNKTHTVRLLKADQAKDFVIGFLRGYFDGDGYARKDSKRIQYISTSTNIVKQISYFLSSLSLGFEIRKFKDKRKNHVPCYYINVTGQDAIKFVNLIKPRNPKRIRKWARRSAWSRIPATVLE